MRKLPVGARPADKGPGSTVTGTTRPRATRPDTVRPDAVRRTGLLLALAAAGISGVAVFLNSYGVKAFGDATTYTAKNVIAALVLVALIGAMSARRPGIVLTRPSRRGQWAGLAVVGVFGGALAFALFFEGLALASATDAAFLQKTLLVWVALLAVPLLGERLGALQVAAIALLVLGQIGLAGGATTPLGLGQLMVLGATLLWAAEVIIAKKLLADLSSWTVGLTRMGVGSVVLVAWTLIRGEGGNAHGARRRQPPERPVGCPGRRGLLAGQPVARKGGTVPARRISGPALPGSSRQILACSCRGHTTRRAPTPPASMSSASTRSSDYCATAS